MGISMTSMCYTRSAEVSVFSKEVFSQTTSVALPSSFIPLYILKVFAEGFVHK